MSAPLKFGIVALVVIGIVALGYYLHKKQLEKNAAATQKPGASTAAAKDSSFAKNPDGSPDYTRKADGTKIMFT